MLTMRSSGASLVAALAFCATGVLAPSAARAHFTMDAPTPFLTQDRTGFPQKSPPCGPGGADPATGTFTNVVTSSPAGQMLTVKVTATIAHPGWYRIALANGSSLSQTATTLPDPPGTTCSPSVISDPVWSPTQLVIADNLPTGSHSFPVMLPSNITCTMADPCTLQAIMVMTDGAFPACYYHHCADIAIDDGPSSGGSPSAADTMTKAGCSCSIRGRRVPTVWGFAGLLGLGVALASRRRNGSHRAAHPHRAR